MQMLAELGLGKNFKLEQISETLPVNYTPDSREIPKSNASVSCVQVIKFPSRPITAQIIDKGK